MTLREELAEIAERLRAIASSGIPLAADIALNDAAESIEEAAATDPRPDPRTHPEYWTE